MIEAKKGSAALNKRIIHLYFRTSDLETLVSFLREYEGIVVTKVMDKYLTLTDSDQFDQIDINHLRELMLIEFYQDFTAFIEPESPNFDALPIIRILSKINPGVYSIASIIPQIVLFNHHDCRIALRNYYYNQIGMDSINTILGFIEADLNASKAAKSLFMHRNTINYRLDHFIMTSGIDIRTFMGAYSFYLLFKA